MRARFSPRNERETTQYKGQAALSEPTHPDIPLGLAQAAEHRNHRGRQPHRHQHGILVGRLEQSALLSAVSMTLIEQEGGWSLFRVEHSGTLANEKLYVLRYTTTVSDSDDPNTMAVADRNAELIYTTAQLVEEITDPSLWPVPCPPGFRANLNLEIQIMSSRPADFTCGWRKRPSAETATADGRFEISIEYGLGIWSKLIYAPLR